MSRVLKQPRRCHTLACPEGMARAPKLVHLVTEGSISQLHLFADDKVTLVRRPLPASRDLGRSMMPLRCYPFLDHDTCCCSTSLESAAPPKLASLMAPPSSTCALLQHSPSSRARLCVCNSSTDMVCASAASAGRGEAVAPILKGGVDVRARSRAFPPTVTC